MVATYPPPTSGFFFLFLLFIGLGISLGPNGSLNYTIYSFARENWPSYSIFIIYRAAARIPWIYVNIFLILCVPAYSTSSALSLVNSR